MRVLNDLPPFGGMLFQTVELVKVFFKTYLFKVLPHTFQYLTFK